MNIFRQGVQAVAVLLMCAGVMILAGCSDDDGYSHVPPPGQGSIIVDNRSSDIIHVYINGYYTNDVGYYDYEAYDRLLGVYRVVLDQKKGDRYYNHDMDVLEGKLSVMKVWINEGHQEYIVQMDYQ